MMRRAAVVMLLALLAAPAPAQDGDALKRDAVSRLIESHDTALPVHIGRVYVKQAALEAARDLLEELGRGHGLSKAQWQSGTADWQAAETELVAGVDALIERSVSSPAWVKAAWSELAGRTLDAEQIDEVAVHFESEGGGLQRRVIEWFVGELTLQTYTFTDRLRYGVAGSEQEMRELQQVTYARKFDGIQDFTSHPNAVRFASSGPGVEYFKMMVIQGVHAVHVHLEQVANEARALIRARAALVEPHLERAAGRR
jgi:hypothetical protein